MAHILACTDGSVYGDSVCDHAAWAHGRLGGSVEVLHVIDHHREHADSANLSGKMAVNQRDRLLQQLADLDEQKSKLLKEHGREVLNAARDRLTADGVAEAKLTLRHGHFSDTVIEVEETADLVVIGKRGEHADFAKMHLGSHLERVVRGSRHPVLVTSRAFQPINRVMLAYDGSATADKALAYLAESPLLNDLDVILFMAGEKNSANLRSLDRAAEKLRGEAGRSLRVELQPGVPSAVISETAKAEKVDLLVVGAYGHSRIRQLLVGSTTTEVVRSCLVPVLMIR